MPLVDDLLVQATTLTSADQRRPKQANLRRAVSAAYYALFHEVTDQIVGRIMTGADARSLVGRRVRRLVEHRNIKDAAGWFAKSSPGGIPAGIKALREAGAVTPTGLVTVCDAFVELHRARFRADYDLSRPFTRLETTRLVTTAEIAVAKLRALGGSADRDIFLYASLFGKDFGRPG